MKKFSSKLGNLGFALMGLLLGAVVISTAFATDANIITDRDKWLFTSPGELSVNPSDTNVTIGGDLTVSGSTSFSGGSSGAWDLNGLEGVLDADGDTSVTADTDDQIDLKISGSDDFQFVANILKALSGSSIETDTINETTSDNGVVIDGVTLKDGGSSIFTGGTNTFNITNGTASLDVAAGSAIDLDTGLTVNTEPVTLDQSLSTSDDVQFDDITATGTLTGDYLIMQNNETVSNVTDGQIQLSGNNGSNDENIVFDLDANANEVGVSSLSGVLKMVFDTIGLQFGRNASGGAGFYMSLTFLTISGTDYNDGLTVACSTSGNGTQITSESQAVACANGTDGFDWATVSFTGGALAGQDWTVLLRTDVFTSSTDIETWLDQHTAVGAGNYTITNEFVGGADNVGAEGSTDSYTWGIPGVATYASGSSPSGDGYLDYSDVGGGGEAGGNFTIFGDLLGTLAFSVDIANEAVVTDFGVDAKSINIDGDSTIIDKNGIDTLDCMVMDNVNVCVINTTLADDAEGALETGISGFGECMLGDDEAYAHFKFSTAGVVTLIAWDNAVSSDTDGYLAIYDAGSGVSIKNRTGSEEDLMCKLTYL